MSRYTRQTVEETLRQVSDSEQSDQPRYYASDERSVEDRRRVSDRSERRLRAPRSAAPEETWMEGGQEPTSEDFRNSTRRYLSIPPPEDGYCEVAQLHRNLSQRSTSTGTSSIAGSRRNVGSSRSLASFADDESLSQESFRSHRGMTQGHSSRKLPAVLDSSSRHSSNSRGPVAPRSGRIPDRVYDYAPDQRSLDMPRNSWRSMPSKPPPVRQQPLPPHSSQPYKCPQQRKQYQRAPQYHHSPYQQNHHDHNPHHQQPPPPHHQHHYHSHQDQHHPHQDQHHPHQDQHHPQRHHHRPHQQHHHHDGHNRHHHQEQKSQYRQPRAPHPVETTVEISPGLSVRLRGAKETWSCIERDFYIPVLCMGCNSDDICCIQDAHYVLCPKCRIVSPLDNGIVDGRPLGFGGVGLGFTFDDLRQWQHEILRGNQGLTGPSAYNKPGYVPHMRT